MDKIITYREMLIRDCEAIKALKEHTTEELIKRKLQEMFERRI